MEQEITILLDEFMDLKVKEEKLNVILKLIFEKTRKYSCDDSLTLYDDRDLMTYLKITESKKYNEKLKSLTKQEDIEKKEAEE